MPSPDRPRDRSGALAGSLLHWAVAGAAAAGSWLLLTGPRRRAAVPAAAGTAPEQDTTSGRGSPGRPASRDALRAGHETRDANSGRLAWIIVLGLAMVLAAIGGLALMLRGFRAAETGAPLTAQQRAAIVPPGPRLQDNPYADIHALRAREDGLLHGHAWLDPAHDRARIPIERAMALTVGQSLDTGPGTAPGTASAAAPGAAPGTTTGAAPGSAPRTLPGDAPR